MDDKRKTSSQSTLANVWITAAFGLGLAFGIGGTLVVQQKAAAKSEGDGAAQTTEKDDAMKAYRRIATVEGMKMHNEVQAVAHTKDVARRDALRVALKLRGVSEVELQQIESKGLKKRGFRGDWIGDQPPQEGNGGQ